VTITTLGTKQKSYKIATLKDGETEWKDLLPFEDPSLVISEFDCFHDFFALYTKRNGVPEIIVQDLETNTFSSVSIDNQVGEIEPGLNSDYYSKELTFLFSSPFTYQQVYKYNHTLKSKKLLKEVKLKGP
jgi:protease II